MLAERRVVIMRDPAALKKAQKERLEQYLAKPAADTILLLVVPSGAKADAALLKKGEAFEFKPLEGDDLLKWIRRKRTATAARASPTAQRSAWRRTRAATCRCSPANCASSPRTRTAVRLTTRRWKR